MIYRFQDRKHTNRERRAERSLLLTLDWQTITIVRQMRGYLHAMDKEKMASEGIA